MMKICYIFSVTHLRRPDGRPFRLVDVNPRPVADIMSDLKVSIVVRGVFVEFKPQWQMLWPTSKF